MRLTLVALTALLALAVSGCLERAEEITVRADGSADVRLAYRGAPGDFDRFLHFPSGDGWTVSKTKETEETDKGPVEVWKWTATKTLGDLNDYPDSFAPNETPHRDRHFRYTTKLTVTEANGLRTYEFEREYPATANAEVYRIDEAQMDAPEFKKLLGKMEKSGLSGLSEDESRRFFEIAARWELEKQMVVAERAVEAFSRAKGLGFDVRQEMRGRVGAAYGERLAGASLEGAMREFLALGDEEKRMKFAIEFLEKARGAAVAACEGIGAVKRAGGFAEAYAAEDTAAAAGTAVSDDRIKLSVAFPGPVVAGNAVVDPLKEKSATWEFDAKTLRDGPVTLRAVAVERID